MARSFVFCLLATGSQLMLMGCSTSMPTAPAGVLSVVHQKALEFAAKRAMEQAQVTSERFGTKPVYVTFSNVQETDLGKQHVVRVITDQFGKVSGGLKAKPEANAEAIECQILLAGVDTSSGSIAGISWIDTKAEVGLRLKCDGQGGPVEKEGTGAAVYQQSWVLGFGPSEKWKQ